MSYDRYDSREGWRDRPSQRRDEPGWGREGGGRREDRGWFEKAGDEISSWFGYDDDRDDDRRERARGGDPREHRSSQRRDHNEFRGPGPERSGDRDYDPPPHEIWGGRDRDRSQDDDRRGYRPVTGDYGRSEQFFAASGTPRGGFGRGEGGSREDDRSQFARSQTPWGRDEYRRTSFAGSSSGGHHHDPHYQSWRDRQMSELDRDYEDYRREHQSRFEDDFRGWRERRQQKRGLLSQIREHMEVVGSDDQPVGSIDRVAGDRIILTKSDPESGGEHHSLSCTEIDRIEGDRVILEATAEKAKQGWRDETRGRALFEREDQGEAGPHVLDRSFEGTYR